MKNIFYFLSLLLLPMITNSEVKSGNLNETCLLFKFYECNFKCNFSQCSHLFGDRDQCNKQCLIEANG